MSSSNSSSSTSSSSSSSSDDSDVELKIKINDNHKKKLESEKRRKLAIENRYSNQSSKDSVKINANVNNGNKITFEYSSDENISSSSSEEETKEETTIKPKSFENDWIGNSSSDEAGEGDDKWDKVFRVNDQIEGKHSRELQKMERRFGGDTRFKLDERFVDTSKADGSDSDSDSDSDNSSVNGKDEAGEEIKDSIDAELQQDHTGQMSILASMFPTIDMDKDKNRKRKKKPKNQIVANSVAEIRATHVKQSISQGSLGHTKINVWAPISTYDPSAASNEVLLQSLTDDEDNAVTKDAKNKPKKSKKEKSTSEDDDSSVPNLSDKNNNMMNHDNNTADEVKTSIKQNKITPKFFNVGKIINNPSHSDTTTLVGSRNTSSLAVEGDSKEDDVVTHLAGSMRSLFTKVSKTDKTSFKVQFDEKLSDKSSGNDSGFKMDFLGDMNFDKKMEEDLDDIKQFNKNSPKKENSNDNDNNNNNNNNNNNFSNNVADKIVSSSVKRRKSDDIIGNTAIKSVQEVINDLSGSFMRSEPLEDIEAKWLDHRFVLTRDFKRKRKGAKTLKRKTKRRKF